MKLYIYIILYFLFMLPIIPNDKSLSTNKESKQFKILSNNKQFLINLILSDVIHITLIEQDSISQIYDHVDLTLENLGKYNKVFKMYDTLEEAYKCLELLFLKEKVSIHISKEKISIVFIMNTPTGEEKEIFIPLEKRTMNTTEINDRLCYEITELKKRIKVLENENTSFKNIIKNLESKLKILIDKLDDKISNDNKTKKHNNIIDIINSKIINKFEDFEFIINRIKEISPNKNIRFNLLYRATKDGDQISTFHSKCDNKIQVLVLYHTMKGVKFGGYTDIGFDSSRNWKQDLKSFIFSIDKKKIYNAVGGKKQIGCYNNNGPSFGFNNVAIYLFDNVSILSQNNQHRTNDAITSFSELQNYEINNGEQYFNLQELEVFQIVFY